jgi:hypothetical protein
MSRVKLFARKETDHHIVHFMPVEPERNPAAAPGLCLGNSSDSNVNAHELSTVAHII